MDQTATRSTGASTCPMSLEAVFCHAARGAMLRAPAWRSPNIDCAAWRWPSPRPGGREVLEVLPSPWGSRHGRADQGAGGSITPNVAEGSIFAQRGLAGHMLDPPRP